MEGQELTKEKKSKKLSKIQKIILIVIPVIVAAAAVILAIPKHYALTVNGEVIGVAKEIEEVNQVIANVEATVSDVLGYDYSFSDSVEVTQSGEKVEGDLETILLEKVTEISELYTLQIDGQNIAACETEEEIKKAMDNVLKRYSEMVDGSARFENEISIKQGLTATALKSTTAEIEKKLDPKNSELPIQIRTVAYETENSSIPFESEYTIADTLPIGSSRIVKNGVDGTMDTTIRVVYINGEETERTEIAEKEAIAPQNEVIAIGVEESASTGFYIWPAKGIISCEFGYRGNSIGSSNHRGIDIAAREGDPIIAADGGVVIFAGEDGTYGNIVRILHENGDVTWYAHCSELLVSAGENVKQGDLIALMGMTGLASGNHLHFEIRQEGKTPIDPQEVLVDKE